MNRRFLKRICFKLIILIRSLLRCLMMFVAREALRYLYPASECSRTTSFFHTNYVLLSGFHYFHLVRTPFDPENIVPLIANGNVRALISLMVSCHFQEEITTSLLLYDRLLRSNIKFAYSLQNSKRGQRSIRLNHAPFELWSTGSFGRIPPYDRFNHLLVNGHASYRRVLTGLFQHCLKVGCGYTLFSMAEQSRRVRFSSRIIFY